MVVERRTYTKRNRAHYILGEVADVVRRSDERPCDSGVRGLIESVTGQSGLTEDKAAIVGTRNIYEQGLKVESADSEHWQLALCP